MKRIHSHTSPRDDATNDVYPDSNPQILNSTQDLARAPRTDAYRQVGMTQTTPKRMATRNQGVPFALASAVFLGLTPVFGKAAILAGLPPLAVVAARSGGAALLLLTVVLLVRRRWLYIFPLGLLGCTLAGLLNGTGSLLYYASLAKLDASLGQLLFALYPVYIAGLLFLEGQQPSKLIFLSLALSLLAVGLLTNAPLKSIDATSVAMMLAAGFFYALHIPINQRVLYEAPAPTVTLYTLFAMTAVVVPAYLLSPDLILEVPNQAAWPLIGLTAVTFLSRLALFAGVKLIGGMKTALLGLAELLVTVGVAHIWLGERLSLPQWIGAGLLVAALFIATKEPPVTRVSRARGWLRWLRPPIPPAQVDANKDDPGEHASEAFANDSPPVGSR
jgi:drug/metabolite transporter (DMT)-like permease